MSCLLFPIKYLPWFLFILLGDQSHWGPSSLGMASNITMSPTLTTSTPTHVPTVFSAYSRITTTIPSFPLEPGSPFFISPSFFAPYLEAIDAKGFVFTNPLPWMKVYTHTQAPKPALGGQVPLNATGDYEVGVVATTPQGPIGFLVTLPILPPKDPIFLAEKKPFKEQFHLEKYGKSDEFGIKLLQLMISIPMLFVIGIIYFLFLKVIL